jgi:hypothetical protein
MLNGMSASEANEKFSNHKYTRASVSLFWHGCEREGAMFFMFPVLFERCDTKENIAVDVLAGDSSCLILRIIKLCFVRRFSH